MSLPKIDLRAMPSPEFRFDVFTATVDELNRTRAELRDTIRERDEWHAKAERVERDYHELSRRVAAATKGEMSCGDYDVSMNRSGMFGDEGD